MCAAFFYSVFADAKTVTRANGALPLREERIEKRSGTLRVVLYERVRAESAINASRSDAIHGATREHMRGSPRNS